MSIRHDSVNASGVKLGVPLDAEAIVGVGPTSDVDAVEEVIRLEVDGKDVMDPVGVAKVVGVAEVVGVAVEIGVEEVDAGDVKPPKYSPIIPTSATPIPQGTELRHIATYWPLQGIPNRA
ncbi:hypothetical protein EYR36_001993 [Pleurotus pulmonarius]|nr:hypothetical protein EYR36_001993 [Pleurotus pulmonarius]KAF4588257.1 hypothetical protein EYR38_010224 [Pleurotus pulmonarius]